ncbi:MAG: HAD family hydrolase [Kiritimatiellae bacterium]|nr:HAD family hydrolase [Kiritimatiellia bacterium]MDW8459208.1 HAD hydrolase family protein [Verrucomicrobiota bacterium]
MKTDPRMDSIRLVALDFDGTVMVYPDPTGVFHPDIIRAINALEALGIRWCTNSGRDIIDQKVVLERSRMAGLTHPPDALICSESFVYLRCGSEYEPLQPWNFDAESRLSRCSREARAALEPHLPRWASDFPGLFYVEQGLFPALRAADEGAQAEALFMEVRRVTANIPRVFVSRNGCWVAVLPEGLGKGPSLSAYAKARGFGPDHILAVGDHQNDLSMLDGRHAGLVGCPADAHPDIREIVLRAGGIVATSAGPEGTLEILDALLRARAQPNECALCDAENTSEPADAGPAARTPHIP